MEALNPLFVLHRLHESVPLHRRRVLHLPPRHPLPPVPHRLIGDKVMVHRECLITPEARDRPWEKLRPRWYGPFTITEVVSPNACGLQLPHQLHCHPVFNVTALKTYHQNTFEELYTEPPPPITDLDGYERFIVERILNHPA